MIIPLPPWTIGPFELLVHAEGHLRDGDDFDRRIALISFDNAIEVSIATFLTLHPIQRRNRELIKADVEKWLANYHSMLDFIDTEIASQGGHWRVERAHIIWAHNNRNEQYHGGLKGTPEKRVLEIVREAALWIFEMLFDYEGTEAALEAALAAKIPQPPPSRDRSFDLAIDAEFGIIRVGEQSYYASELLFSIDANAYRDLGGRLCPDPIAITEDLKEQS